MLKLKTLIIVLLTLIISISANAENVKAPSGFKWGQTIEEIRSQGINILNSNPAISGEVYIHSATNAPKKLTFAESYVLLIDKKYGLQKVSILGTIIKNDPYGDKGKKKLRQHRKKP